MVSIMASEVFSFNGTSLITSLASTSCVLTNKPCGNIIFCPLDSCTHNFFISFFPYWVNTCPLWHHRDLLFNSMHIKPIGAAGVSQMHL